MNRWHPSRATREQIARTRELVPELAPWMYDKGEIELVAEISRIESFDPEARVLGALHLILLRRLERRGGEP